jgi:thiol:disulfide interchange protein DsbD
MNMITPTPLSELSPKRPDDICSIVKRVALLVLASLALATNPVYPSETNATEPAAVSPSEALSTLGVNVEAGELDNVFLQPDVAFIFSIEFTHANTIVARWEIAKTYYLYRSKFDFALRGTPGAALSGVVILPGKIKNDPYFGPVEVFYETAQATLTLQNGETSTSEIVLDVTYQGCTDLGLCYPPITKTVTLAVPVVSN